MSDSRWYELFVQGMGRICVWACEDVFTGFSDGEIEVENVTHFIQTSQGILPAKGGAKRKIRREAVIAWGEAVDADVEGLSKMWDQSRIEIASAAAKSKISRHD